MVVRKSDNTPFGQYLRSRYSQNGEDGVIEEILFRLGLIKSATIDSLKIAWSIYKNVCT